MGSKGTNPDPKDEVRVEGRLSDEHTHNDDTKGRDAYAARVAYRDGRKLVKKMPVGDIHIGMIKILILQAEDPVVQVEVGSKIFKRGEKITLLFFIMFLAI